MLDLAGTHHFFGIFAPKGTPDAVVKKLSDVMAKVSQEKDYRDKMHKMGTQVLFEETKAFEKTVNLYKENLQAFFKEEGLVK